ncbi:MAG: uroporphyrinogen-III synthase [Pseudomonadota bacterium]
MARNPLLLMTRARPQSEAFVSDLVGHLGRTPDHLISPILDIHHKPVDIPDGVQAVLFTSANGVQSVRDPQPIRAICVGDTTAEAASDAGFSAISAGGDAEDLLMAALALLDPSKGRVIHVSGDIQAKDLSVAFQNAGLTYQNVVGYEAKPVALSPEALAAVAARSVVAPVFSPRSAKLLSGALNGLAGFDLQFVAISEAAADALGRPCKIASAPTRAQMVQSVGELL